MDTAVENVIRELVSEEAANSRFVDAVAIAAKAQARFPAVDLPKLTQLVLGEVSRKRVNAVW